MHAERKYFLDVLFKKILLVAFSDMHVNETVSLFSVVLYTKFDTSCSSQKQTNPL